MLSIAVPTSAQLAKATIRYGVTRCVFVVEGLAFKVARDQWGRGRNKCEAGIWQGYRDHPTRGPHLCPVLWSDPSGVLLIMAAADPVSDEQLAVIRSDENGAWDWWDYFPGGNRMPWEMKAADWGVLDGRIVCVDYSTPALFPTHDPV